MLQPTTLCYLERDGQYLMLHRTTKSNDINHDKWIGVGGKFEEGESPEECMLREVREETGFTVTRWRYRGIVTFVSDIYGSEHMHLFTCTEWEGEQKPCDEGVLEWVGKDRISELNIWEGDKIFLDLLRGDVPFFSLKLTYHGDTLTAAILNGKAIR
ncbi:MAG: 8-oxo-dGTP diphosphatase [Bacteroidales bacterium]|jgi:8-oxo-dGTP diphosphatase|nr:8-oxo-dGTP diphosphatase [Bacteroidales bacterium]